MTRAPSSSLTYAATAGSSDSTIRQPQPPAAVTSQRTTPSVVTVTRSAQVISDPSSVIATYPSAVIRRPSPRPRLCVLH